jgi:hypothetical protein
MLRRTTSGRVVCRGWAELAQAVGSAELSESHIPAAAYGWRETSAVAPIRSRAEI